MVFYPFFWKSFHEYLRVSKSSPSSSCLIWQIPKYGNNILSTLFEKSQYFIYYNSTKQCLNLHWKNSSRIRYGVMSKMCLKLSHVFYPFWRINATKDAWKQGNGIGSDAMLGRFFPKLTLATGKNWQIKNKQQNYKSWFHLMLFPSSVPS